MGSNGRWRQGCRPSGPDTGRNDSDRSAGRHGPRLAEKALSRGTRSVYARAVASFDDWRGARPATDASLADYLGVLFERGMAPATASVVVAAVAETAGHMYRPCAENSQIERLLVSGAMVPAAGWDRSMVCPGSRSIAWPPWQNGAPIGPLACATHCSCG